MAVSHNDELLAKARALPALAPLLQAAANTPDRGVYLVGGVVRDLLLGSAPIDIDVCVEGPIETLIGQLPGEVQVHERFGTATVTLGAVRYDVAQTRSEVYPQPGALPLVQAAPLSADLQRRDFTVNAMALALCPGQAGELTSAADALTDLRLRRLQVLHDASFSDDPTRLFRLARYSARLRFKPGPSTAKLAEQAVAGGAVGMISGARIGNELRLIAAEADPVAAFAAMAALGLDRAVHPEFGLGPDHSERAAIAQEALALLPHEGRRDLLVLAAAFLHVPSDELSELLDQLAFTAPDRETITAAAGRSPTLSAALRTRARPSQIADAIGGATPAAVALAGALGARQQAWEWLERLRHLQLQIDGKDLLDAGVPQGRAVGAGLAAARDALLDGHAADREIQLRIALEVARAG